MRTWEVTRKFNSKLKRGVFASLRLLAAFQKTMSNKKTTENHLPESKRKTLPRDFASYPVFKSLQKAVSTKTHTVTGWIEVPMNREKLANALSGVMEGGKLADLRNGGTKVLERWAKKLRNQLRSSGTRKRSRAKSLQRIAMGRNTQRLRSDRFLSSSLKNLIAHFKNLDKKFHNITSSGPAGEFRKLACDLRDVAIAFEKNAKSFENEGHNDMNRAPSALARNSVVWVLKGHIFENSIVKQVSSIIREISPDKIDIIWSNFSVRVCAWHALGCGLMFALILEHIHLVA